MRIVIHGINYRPELIGIGKYSGEIAEWLEKHGHTVRVVTAHPYYPAWRLQDGYRTWWYRRERIAGVDVWRCPLWVPRKPSGIKRIVHLLSFAFTSFPLILWQIVWRPDVIMTIEPPLLCAPQAWLAARLSGAKAWLHIQDFEVEAFFGLGFGSSSLLKKVLIRIESWLMRRFDHISTISQTMLSRITHLRVSQNCTSLLPNWVDVHHIRPGLPGRDLRAEWGFSPDQQIVLYAGNMGKKQGLELILDAAEVLSISHSQVVFLMVGEGAAKAGLIEQAQKRRLMNVRFKPLQPAQDLPALLALADIHLVIQKRGAADAVMPSKLTAILAAGGYAIITADTDTELGRLVSDNPGIAVLVKPESKDAFIQVLSLLLSRQMRESRINMVAREYAVQHLAVNVVLNNFEKNIIELIGKRTDDRKR